MNVTIGWEQGSPTASSYGNGPDWRPHRNKGIYITRPTQLPGYHGWERPHIWLDGIPMGEVEILLDGKLVARFEGPPNMVGRQDHQGDHALPKGAHELTVRARDGDGWLVQVFSIVSAG